MTKVLFGTCGSLSNIRWDLVLLAAPEFPTFLLGGGLLFSLRWSIRPICIQCWQGSSEQIVSAWKTRKSRKEKETACWRKKQSTSTKKRRATFLP